MTEEDIAELEMFENEYKKERESKGDGTLTTEKNLPSARRYVEKRDSIWGVKYFPCSRNDEGAEEMSVREIEPEQIGMPPITPVRP